MKNTMSSTRILWIDYVKAFAIITVVMLHIPILDPYRHIAHSFVIPIFFFLSGLFSHPDRYKTFSEFLRKKTLRLLIPYVIFNLLNYLYWLFVARHFGADAEVEVSLVKPIVGMLLGIEPWMYHYKPLWFLPCLMLTEIFFYALYRLIVKWERKRCQVYLAITMVSVSAIGYSLSILKVPALPYGIGGALSMSLFYYGGYLLYAHSDWRENVRDYVARISPIKLLSLIIVSVCACIGLSMSTEETQVFVNSYGNILYAFPAAICGGITLIGIAIGLSKWLSPLMLLQYVGTHTLTILGIHLTTASLIKGFTVFILRQPLCIYEYLWVRLLLVIVTVMLCLPFCYLSDYVARSITNSISTN